MSGSPSADRLGQALSSYSLRPPAEGAADSGPPPVLQAPTDVSAAGVVLENARLGGVHSVASEGVASAGLPPQVGGRWGPLLTCMCRQRLAVRAPHTCIYALLLLKLPLPPVQAAGEAVGEFVPPAVEATHSLAAGFQGETSGGWPGGCRGSRGLHSSERHTAGRLQRFMTLPYGWSQTRHIAGLHDGGTAGGSTYGFGETVAAGPTPGTASAQVPWQHRAAACGSQRHALPWSTGVQGLGHAPVQACVMRVVV